MNRHLHLDPFAGIAGDMFLGACIDLGVALQQISEALKPIQMEYPYRLAALPAWRQSIRGIDFKVHVENGGPAAASHDHHSDALLILPGAKDPLKPAHSHDHSHDHGHDHSHDHGHSHDHSHDAHGGHTHAQRPHTGYKQIMSMIDLLDSSERARQRARAIVTRLAEAEASVHGMSIDQVHFHEVGAVDSIVDMLGAAVALEILGVETLSCGPLPIGTGFIKCDHGMMPLPAPATAHLLKGVPHYGVQRKCETVTPTGAAIVAALCLEFGPQPVMNVEAVGYGAGDRDDKDVPNLLRVFMGRRG